MVRLFAIIVLAYSLSIVFGALSYVAPEVFRNWNTSPAVATFNLFPILITVAWLMFSPMIFLLMGLFVIFEDSIQRHYFRSSALSIFVFNTLLAALFWATEAGHWSTAMLVQTVLSTLFGSVIFSIAGRLLLSAMPPNPRTDGR
jgi:hypothetical protein